MRVTRIHLMAAALGTAITIGVNGVAGAQAAPGDDGPYLIKGGTIVNPGGQRQANTDILIRNNRIVAIGAGAAAGNAKVIDATGKFVVPGL